MKLTVGSKVWSKRFRNAVLVAGCLIGFAQAQEARLDGTARPLNQSVVLKTDPAAETFSGSTRISLELSKETSEIRLHAADIQIKKATLTLGDQSLGLTPKAGGDGTVTLSSATALKAGRYSLELQFEGPFNKRSSGLYKYTDQGLAYLSSQFEMSAARLCFPCFDEPSFKIPYQLTIEAPKAQNVYSNTPETKTTAKGEWVVHEFAQTPPMPSYLVALAVGPYEDAPVEKLSVPGRIVTPKGKLPLSAFSRRETPKILGALEDYFGIKYPYEKLDQVAVTEFPFGAMENAGMVTYREDLLLVNEATIQEDSKTSSLMVISHELAHQWFGNLVTMKWWDDLWLNEAFATWMAAKVVNGLYPELEYDLMTPQNRVMSQDANLSTKPIRKPIRNEADIFDGLGLAYNKGGAVLNMVERWMGEKTFQAGMRAYLTKHRFGNADAADLWNALGEASGKDVESVLKTFTEQSGFPLVSVATYGRSLEISQTRFLNAGTKAGEQSWTLPIFIRYGNGSKQAVTTVLLDGPSTTVELEFEPTWVFPDDGAVGYFRWQMGDHGEKALLANRDKLSNREKLALMYNLQGLVKADLMPVGEVMHASRSFLSDAHPTVVAFALGVLDANRHVFVNEGNRAAWKTFLRGAIQPVVDRFGLTPKAGESTKVKNLRPLLLRLLAEELGDEKVIATARSSALGYLSDPGKVDPSLVDVYLQIAARHGDVAMVEAVKKAMIASTDPQRRTSLLETLGMFGGAEAQGVALDLMLDPAVTASDLRTLLGENGVEEERRLRLLAWLEANYDALVAKLPTPFLNVVPASVGDAPDRERLEAVLAFFADKPDTTGAIGRETAKIKERVTTTIETRERGQASFDKFLKTPQHSEEA